MVPINEQEVVYLFSRNHEKLGFEEIIRFSSDFPDCIAVQEGKKVGIEFEYELENFFIHYFESKFVPATKYSYNYQNGKILIYRKDSLNRLLAEYDNNKFEVWNPEMFNISPSLWVKGYRTSLGMPLVIKKKTLSSTVQYVVCWKTKNKKLNDSIEIIELQNMNLK